MCSYEKVDFNKEQTQPLCSLLDTALGSTGRVKKVRRLFLVDQTRIHVDSVEGLGDFAELEVQFLRRFN